MTRMTTSVTPDEPLYKSDETLVKLIEAALRAMRKANRSKEKSE